MRKFRLIWIYLSALLLAGACSRIEETSSLSIYVRLPEQELTKAGPDWTSLQAKETRINDLRIWVFLGSTTDGSLPPGTLLGYLEPKQLIYSGGREQKFVVPLDRTLAKKLKTVDVYVLANAAAAGQYAIGSGMTPAELDGLVLSGELFGIASNGEPTNTNIIDNIGLPYSAVGKGLTLNSSGSELSVTNVELVRAVSKVQFVFCQIKDADGGKPVDFQITGLKLNAGQIPGQEYLFNDSSDAYKIGSTYAAGELKILYLPAKADIAGSTSPGSYVYTTGERKSEYQDRIDAALREGAVTGCAPCYLRESDKAMQGEIRYRIGSMAEKSLPFSMVAGEKFSRNSSWIVYFYFNNDTMSLSASYANWRTADDGKNGKYIIGE